MCTWNEFEQFQPAAICFIVYRVLDTTRLRINNNKEYIIIIRGILFFPIKIEIRHATMCHGNQKI